jgi:integrase
VARLSTYTHGLRVSELINLRWNQINFDTGRISVRRLKGSEDGEHVLRGREIRALKALKRAQTIGSQFVFLSYQGAPMTRQAFDKMLRAAGAEAGIPDVHAHLLRHGCGYRLVNIWGSTPCRWRPIWATPPVFGQTETGYRPPDSNAILNHHVGWRPNRQHVGANRWRAIF